MALLMGIIIPSYWSARDKAKYTTAKSTAKSLETAFKLYYDYYHVWPTDFGGGSRRDVDAKIVDVLIGRNNPPNPDNKDAVAFFEFDTNAVVHGMMDPWSNTNDPDTICLYWVQVDHDYDNKIILANGAELFKSVIVGSPGSDRTNDTPDDVRSWE